MIEPDIHITVQTQFLSNDSNRAEKRFVFAYTINITNHTEKTIQLLSRYWKITDADNKEEEVHGEGVIGQQPFLAPGNSYEYSSGAVLKTPAGFMEGHYNFVTEDKETFQADIPAFSLIDPDQLH